MMNRITKNTVMIVVFITVCIASFVAVRQLTRNEQINNPIINVNNSTAMPTESTSGSTAADPTTTKPTTTAPTVTTTLPTTTLPSTTKPIPSTTIVAPTTTAPTTMKPTTTSAASTTDPYIQQAAQQSQGFLGYMFNDDGNFYYTASDPWQRNFGFNKLYDFGAQFVFMFYDSARIFFDYGDKNWMVEFWKGQYGGVFIGAEIGVYTKPKDREVEHYDCANNEEALYMDMTFYRKGEELLSREYMKYWWCTGFVPGKLDKYSDRSELSIKTRITMKDKKMRKAFINGLETCEEFVFIEGENFFVDGLDVFIEW